jgi:hypothetical protein
MGHLIPNSFQKMNCRLAIQTLSATVAATIKTFLEDGRLKSDTALNTVNFISKVDEIFVALNSATLYSKKKTRSGVSNENYWIIDTLKSVEGLVGFIKRSMDGLISIISKFKSLSGSKLTDVCAEGDFICDEGDIGSGNKGSESLRSAFTETFLSSPLLLGEPCRPSSIAKTFFGLRICWVNSVILSSLSVIGFCIMYSNFKKTMLGHDNLTDFILYI